MIFPFINKTTGEEKKIVNPTLEQIESVLSNGFQPNGRPTPEDDLDEEMLRLLYLPEK